jgi:catechol 2,3-dioxygenase-like lactoylglutathione lyase family enzyme
MTQTPRFAFALEYVTDVEEAKRFYAEVLGLPVQRYHPNFVQFDNFAIANDTSLSGRRDTELYWAVDDAEAAFRELAPTADIFMEIEQKPFGKVFGVKNPSGEPRFLIEFAADRPSTPTDSGYTTETRSDSGLQPREP